MNNSIRASRRIALATLVAFVAFGTLATLNPDPSQKTTTAAQAQEKVVRIYTGRHYPADQELYKLFTQKTGIRVQYLEGKTDQLLEKLRLEGDNTPADLFVTVDAGNLWRTEQAELFQPVDSAILSVRVPQVFRSPDKLWYGFATRYRIVFYDPNALDTPPTDWGDLAKPTYRGKICVRSSANIYNLSLMAALIQQWGEEKAQKWAAGVVANFAQPPAGGDTDQLRAAASGICAIAIANHYYYARLVASGKDADKKVAAALKPLWLGENGGTLGGVHANISGAGVLRAAKNKDEAIAFMEFLAGDQAQAIFARANNEYPVVAGVPLSKTLQSLGAHRTANLNVAILGRNQPAAQRVYDRAGWE